jgi:hypothetical protein
MPAFRFNELRHGPGIACVFCHGTSLPVLACVYAHLTFSAGNSSLRSSPVITTDSVSPQNGSGGSQVFTFVFSHSNGYQDLHGGYILFSDNAGSSGDHFCWMAFSTTHVSLATDDLIGAWPGVDYGANATVQNSQCAVNGVGSSVSGSGNSLTLTLSITFRAAYAGMKTIYSNVNSSHDYAAVGTYNVTATAPDFTLSVSPSSQDAQAGQSVTYTVTVNPLNGFHDNVALSFVRSSTNATISDLTGTFDPASIAGGGSSTLTVTIPASTPTSGWVLQVTGTSSITHAATAELHVTGAAPPPPPTRTTVSVSPQNGTGGSQVFTFVFSDSNGYQDLHGGHILFSDNAGSSGDHFCWMQFSTTNAGLAPDNFIGAWPTVTYGSDDIVQNSQCAIDGTNSSVSGSGNTLTVNLSITFRVAYAGMKTIYTDINPSNGYASVGTYNVTPTSPDFSLSVSPSSQNVSAGQSVTYTVTANSLNAFSDDIALSFNRSSNNATLSNVTGTFTPTSITGGGSSTLTVSVPASTDTSQWVLGVTGTSSSVTHTATAQLNVAGATPPPPPTRTTDSVSPQNGSGGSQVFTFAFSDSNGYEDLFRGFHVLFAGDAGSSGTNFCWVLVSSTGVRLAQDDLSRAWPGVSYGSNAIVQNSQCAIDGAGSGISGSGNTLTLHLSVTFRVAYAGMKTIYTDVNPVNDYVSVGTYNVTPTAPDFTLSISPSSQSVQPGGSTTYTVTANPLNGFNENIALSFDRGSAGGNNISEVSGTFNPGSLAGGGTSTLTVTTAANTPVSTWALRVTGTAPSVTHFASAQLGISGTTPPPPPTVSTVSVSPQNGSGSGQVFTFHFSDTNGYRNLLSGNYHILVNAAPDGTNSCWIQLLSTGVSFAPDDPALGWGFVLYGVAGALQNSQCAVNGSATTISGSGNDLTLYLSLTFTGGFAGARNVYTDVNASAPYYTAVTSYTVQ